VRTAEEERRQDLERLEQEARRVDLKTAEYKSKLAEKSALCDRFRGESDTAVQELSELRRERKQWQLDHQEEHLQKARTVLGQAESRHGVLTGQLRANLTRLQEELGVSRKDQRQWETVCSEQTGKLERRGADLEHLREENLRITHKATTNINSSMQEVDALKAERAQLQHELAEAQTHHESIVEQIKGKECTACLMHQAKVERFQQALEEHRGQAFPEQVATLREELHNAKRTLAKLRHDNHQLLSVSSSQTSSLQTTTLDFDMYLKDLS
jgi:chromosome segregation ATPase